MASAKSQLQVEVLPASRTGATRTATAPGGRRIRHERRHDGIYVLTFDRPGSTANLFDADTLAELDGELDFIDGRPEIKGLLLTSAKPSIFIAGADLNAMRPGAPLEAVRRLIERGQAVMNRIAALPIPTAAAIHGAAAGGGCEICLACDYRVASADRVTRIGLPETRLGLLPAWGGATRLPRLIGLRAALDLILGGRLLTPLQALELGLVDDLAAKPYLLEAALHKLRLGKPRRSRHSFQNNAAAAAAVAWNVRRELMRKGRTQPPAVLKTLQVVTRGVSRSMEASLALEREAFLELVQTEACHNLIRLFFLEERARKRSFPDTLPQAEPEPVAHAAVIGAGIMGAGIAQCLSARRVEVALRDVTADQVARGVARITRLYQNDVARHSLGQQEMDDGLGRIQAAPAETPLPRVEFVIEAAFEELEVKRGIFRRLDEQTSPETVLATNTSALPVADIAAGTRHPERVVGLHFFNPVNRMQLVEVVAARQTAPEVVQRALRFAQQLGKLPVLVKDSPGFVANRILTPYFNEALRLFEDGSAAAVLDAVMLDFGFPMGPLRLLDEVGLDVELHIAETLAARFGEPMAIPDVLRRMVAAGWLGRKSGRGFFVHDGARRPEVNRAVVPLIRSQIARGLPREELQKRLALVMINEAARCLQEEVVAGPDDVDFVMIKGMGFAPHRGGLLRFADSVGAAWLVDAMERLVDSGATRFAPCALLRSMAAGGKKFYSGTWAPEEQRERKAA